MIIDETGFFEWDGEEGNKSVPGYLTVDDGGRICLKMHSSLGGEPVVSTPLEDKKIRGVLNRSAREVLLTGLQSYPVTFSDPVVLHFDATRCFISRSAIDADAFNGLRLPLQGLDNWFSPGILFAPVGTEDRMNFVIEKSPAYVWPLANAILSLKSRIDSSFARSKPNTLEAKLCAEFELIRDQVTPVQELLDWVRGFEEFISLIIDAPHSFSWPTLLWSKDDKTHQAQCYFPRLDLFERKAATSFHGLPFKKIKDTFGDLLTSWLSKKEEFGPGTHLYLGTLRNPHLYIEHQFVSLVWGLEALDRRNKDCIILDNEQARKAKAEEILLETCINTKGAPDLPLNKSKRNWLKGAIENAAERTLAERLYGMLYPIAFNIQPALLTTFCETCATQRNHLSHTGGANKAEEYDAFTQNILPLQKALIKLYRLVLLDMIGVEPSLLKWSMEDSLHSFDFQYCLRRAELITKDEFIERKGPAALKHA